MASKKDTEQVSLDLQAATERLAALRRAIERRDDCAAKVRNARIALEQCRRRLREAEWDVTVALGEERRLSPTDEEQKSGKN
jgi:Cdc6-like AAA superfamily ATPase